ncbi:MAG: hypothetical protein AABX40_00480 [Candidatus Hydrothermarchaeota archaeon]|mgnify:CR=1 FL=1
MNRRAYVGAAILLILSTIVLVDKLFAPRPIQILMDGGQTLQMEGTSVFTLQDVFVLVLSAWVSGATVVYLLLWARGEERITADERPEMKPEDVLRLLEGDERRLYQRILDSGGEILQKDLVLESDFNKAKVTRLLDKLEEKRLISRVRHGMTNRIILA